MTTEERDEKWAALADAEAQARQDEMVKTYSELAKATEEARRERIRAMVRAEYELPEAKLRAFTVSRLRAWLSLPGDEAGAVASSYDAVMTEMPAKMAMQRVSMVQTVVLDFEAEEEERLRALVPNVFAGHPGREKAHKMAAFPAARAAGTAKAAPRWMFWRKGSKTAS